MTLAVVTIPLWTWPVLALGGLWLLAWEETRRINRKAENFRAGEAERIARKNAAPLGSVDRIYDWERAA